MPGEKILHWKEDIFHGLKSWKKNLTQLYVGENWEILSLEVWRKKSLSKPNHPYPPPYSPQK